MVKRKVYKSRNGKIFNTPEEAARENRRSMSDVEYRYYIKSKNTQHPKEYVIPFEHDKKKVLTNAGLATGAIISENLLDTIAKHADTAGLPIRPAIGLGVKESTLGNPTDDGTFYLLFKPGPLREDFKALHDLYGTEQHLNYNEEDLYPREVFNWHMVDSKDPYQQAIDYATSKSMISEDGDIDREKFLRMLELGEKYADSKVQEYEDTYGKNNVVENAFRFYRNTPDKYNPGLSNYQLLVDKRSNEVMNSPEILEWYNNMMMRNIRKPDPITIETPWDEYKKANGGPLEWKDLSMRDRTVYIRLGVANGLKNIDSIRAAYNKFGKGGNKNISGLKQVFLQTLDASLKDPKYRRYNTPLWRNFLTLLANTESGYRSNVTNDIGAKGYFLLMPSNRSSNWETPTQQFHETYNLFDSNLAYLSKNMTKKDWETAKKNGIDIYGLMGGAHLGGPGNVIKALRGKGNAKDKNGTSVLSYMHKFSLGQSNTSDAKYYDKDYIRSIYELPVLSDYRNLYAYSNYSDDSEDDSTQPVNNLLFLQNDGNYINEDILKVALDGISNPNYIAFNNLIPSEDVSPNVYSDVYNMQDILNSSILKYVMPAVTATDILELQQLDLDTLLLKELEDSILRNYSLGNYNPIQLLRDLALVDNEYADGGRYAYGGNLYGFGDWLKKGWNALTAGVNPQTHTTSGSGYIPVTKAVSTPRKTVYKSLTGKVFNSANEAAIDNLNATKGRGEYADKDLTYKVQSGDSLWGISLANNIDVNTLRRMNPSIKGDLIYPGDNLVVGKQKGFTLKDVRKEWEREKELNTDNLKAIQGVKHDDNYVVIDKLNSLLTVFDKNNQPLYQTSDISTGKSGNDYNTITYVDQNGKIRSGAGNESTPAGITKITGTGIYHGFPSFTRGRNQGEEYEDIASSLHFGGTKDKKASNGCVRIGGQSLQNLSNYIGMGTDVYTLPEKRGSRFKVSDGKLSFVADNPYGEQEGSKKYWDDYNTYTDKSYSPLTIVDKKQSNDSTYHKNRASYANSLSSSKEKIQRMFNIDSDTYNRLANIALGIAEQETKYGTSTRKAIKDATPDVLLNILRGNNNRSRGMTQIKLHGDNKEMQAIYNQLGITDKTLESPEGAALATIARLAHMYNTEVRGRNFVGANKATINPYDALLYKWMGRGNELSSHTATPELNNYINNVKRYQKDFDMYTMRAYGGNLFDGDTEPTQQMQTGRDYWTQLANRPTWLDTLIAPVNGGQLSEVVVKPTDDESWLFSLGRYARNSRKPLADSHSRKVVANYLSRFDNESAKDYNARISRLADTLDVRGVQFIKNNVESGKLKNRAHYDSKSNTAYIDDMQDIFAEIAHPWQDAMGNNSMDDEFKKENYDPDIDSRGGTRYAYPDTFEGETHGFFQPAITEWVETGKIGRSLPLLNEDLSNEKIVPNNNMEVLDSAASWNKQAIDRRLLANPHQLPLTKRIQYSFWDYPLLKKKAEGGNIFDGGGYVREKNNNPIAFDEEGNLVDLVTGEKGYVLLPELSVTANPDDVARGRAQRWYRDFGIESNDATSVADGRRQNSHLDERGIEGAAKAAAWMKDNPTLNNIGMALGATPLALAGYPAFMAAGEEAAIALTNPYVDAALTSYFGAHGLNHAINEGIDGWGDAAMTALEVAPLGRLVKPMFNAGDAALFELLTKHPLIKLPISKSSKVSSETLANLKDTSWYQEVSKEFGEDVANLAVLKLQTPGFFEWFYGENPQEALLHMDRFANLRDIINKVTGNIDEGKAAIAGSGAGIALGHFDRAGAALHDLDVTAYMSNPSKTTNPSEAFIDNLSLFNFDRLSQSPIFLTIREAYPEAFKNAKVTRTSKLLKALEGLNRWWNNDFKYGKVLPNPFPDSYREGIFNITPMFNISDLGANRVAMTRINGEPIDIFLSDRYVPTVGNSLSADNVLGWKKAFIDKYEKAGRTPRAKDIKDIENYVPFSEENPVINAEGRSLYAPFSFKKSTLIDDLGIPVLAPIETYPGSNQYVPAFMNYKGEMRSLSGEPLAGNIAPQITAENATSEMPNIVRTVQDNGKIRLSLPSHTDAKPRLFVLEPAGDNKYYFHMRTWDDVDKHIPASLSAEEKNELFEALFNEIPEGAEILLPKSSMEVPATKGTIAGLERFAKDSRFTPGTTKGTLLYKDKDGKIKTYEGTSFIKTPQITEENAATRKIIK